MTQYDSDITALEDRVLSAFMQRLQVTAPGRAPRMPTPDVLILKAQLIRNWEAQRLIRRPIELMEPFEIVATAAAGVLLLSWSVPSAFAWVERLIF
jgi:hypothetical protein